MTTTSEIASATGFPGAASMGYAAGCCDRSSAMLGEAAITSEVLPKGGLGMRVSLSGPDVFFSNAVEIGQAKKRICAQFGFEGVYPLDAK